MTDEYESIDCGLHDQYQMAVMHRQRLDVHWLGTDGETIHRQVQPTDVITREGAEYLMIEEAPGEIRLDRIEVARNADTGEPLL
ncbi:MAG: hypothetical protein KZQ58_07845 [gamma proteobacterium symbiont of Bathyaustriella thionipta]|nr:hypothetical protein [gamma proteobacterium symbiont of Bathyaustriella thionipta]